MNDSNGTSRRAFLKHAASAAALPLLAGAASRECHAAAGDMLYVSAAQLARLVRDRKISSFELVSAFLKRIEEVNPRLNAVVLLCAERALREAREADGALAGGNPRGALHGVPMTVSDSFETAGLVSTGGTLGRKNYMPARDATAIARLRAAGAIVIGKTNVGELSLLHQTDNLIHGRTVNPYDAARGAGGSMGGAAAIVAAGGSPFDIGSDIEGGLRIPAHCCGIAALKPTRAAVPRTGHVIGYGGLCDPYQQVGPMARRVEDLALLFPILAGMDTDDAVIAPVPAGAPDAVKLQSLRAAFYTAAGVGPEPTAETVAAVGGVAKILGSAGLTVREDCPRDIMREADDIRARYDGADDRAWVKRIVERHGTKSAHPALPLGGNLVTAAEFTSLAEKIDLQRSRLLTWLRDYDVVICPVSAAPARLLREEPTAPPSYPRDYGYTGIFNLAGWPAAVVRAGTSPEGLPIGVQIVGRPWREDVVLAVARFVETETGGWKPAVPAKGKA